MQRTTQLAFAYGLAVLLFVVVFAFGFYVVKTTNAIHPAVVLGMCGAVYTMTVLGILHLATGTLKPAPGEVREPERVPENEMDVL